LLRSDSQTVKERMSEEMARFNAALTGGEFAEVLVARREGRPPQFPR